MNEAETCRKLVRPGIESAGWGVSPHVLNEQASFTDGRIVVASSKVRRRPQNRAGGRAKCMTDQLASRG
jgi:type I site-specific restriction endonuclease